MSCLQIPKLMSVCNNFIQREKLVDVFTRTALKRLNRVLHHDQETTPPVAFKDLTNNGAQIKIVTV